MMNNQPNLTPATLKNYDYLLTYLMHLAEARLFTKFLAGASLLMSFHL